MKPYRALFEKYSNGLLDEPGIELLNLNLIEVYFESIEQFNQEELEYTEDLIFELYSGNKLDEKYIQLLKIKIANDRPLQKRYLLFSNLMVSNDIKSRKKSTLHIASQLPENEKKEEEELEKVLQEVIEKVHKENQPIVAESDKVNILLKLKTFFDDLISQMTFHQPQLRPILAVASLALIIFVVWTSVRPGMREMTADHLTPGASNNKQIARQNSEVESQKKITDKDNLTNDNSSAKSISENAKIIIKSHKRTASPKLTKQDNFEGLLAANYAPPTSFDYTILRSGESSNANDLFILAADKYNERDYDSCIIILQNVLSRNYFRSSDTLGEIHFFLGNCFLQKGMSKNNSKQIELSVRSFELVDRQNQHYAPSKWYEALAQIKLGNVAEGLRLLDLLTQINYIGSGNVIMIRDSLRQIMKQ
jgi:hypothetical protein